MLRAFTRNDTFSNAYEYLIGDYALVIIVLIMLWLRFWPNLHLLHFNDARSFLKPQTSSARLGKGYDASVTMRIGDVGLVGWL